MKITFIGTSHGHSEKGRFCTGLYIEHNGNGYILDTGAPIEKALTERDIPLESVKAVFITHMHADHTAHLPDLIKDYTVYHKTGDVNFFLPEENGIQALITWVKANHLNVPQFEKNCHMNLIHAGVIFDADGLKVSAIRTEHIAPDVPSYAFLFETDDGKRVLFTGDLSYDYHDFPQIAKEQPMDLVVSELVHLNPVKAQDILRDVKTRLMIFSHLGVNSVRALEENRIRFDFPHIIAVDGFEYFVI